MKLGWLGMLLSVGGAIVCHSEEVGPSSSDFIRFVKQDGERPSDQLQTALVRYAHSKRGETVDLMAVIHIGDEGYYSRINQILKNYDTVFFEMVGDEKRRKRVAEKNRKTPKFPQTAQQQIVQFLGLQHQRDWIDYEPDNFVHADLDWSQLFDLMESRNQSLTSTFQNMSRAQSQKGTDLMKSAFFGTLTGGDRIALKRGMARQLSDTERLVAIAEGDQGTVLVRERNNIAMQKLKTSLAQAGNEDGQKKYAILYGAAHMPNFEDQLIEIGFKKTAEKWLAAWSISTPGQVKSKEETPMDRYLRSLTTGDAKQIEAAKRALSESNDTNSGSD